MGRVIVGRVIVGRVIVGRVNGYLLVHSVELVSSLIVVMKCLETQSLF